MKTLIVALIAFSTLFIIGFTNERKNLSTPEAIEASVFGRSTFALYQGRYVIVYPDKQRNPKIIYDPEKLVAYPVGQLEPIDPELAKILGIQLKFDPKTPIQIINFANPIAASTTGSIALGISAKELLSNPSLRIALREAPKDRRIVMSAIAAITGYSLGVFAAQHLYLPDIESPEVSKMISNSLLWHKNHLHIFILAIINAENELQAISDVTIRTRAINALNAATKVVAERLNATASSEKIAQLKSSDIEYIVKSLAPFQAELLKSANATTSWSQVIAGLLWLPVVCLAAAILCTAAIFAWEYRSERRMNALPKISG